MLPNRCFKNRVLIITAQLAFISILIWYIKRDRKILIDPNWRFWMYPDERNLPSRGNEYRYANSTSGPHFDFNPDNTTLDKFRLFRTKMFVLNGTKWTKLSTERKVCLGAQTSIDRSHWLIRMAEHWTGPMSIALFVPDVEYDISKVFLSYMRRCFPLILRQASFHFTFPVKHPVGESETFKEIKTDNWPCDRPQELLKLLVGKRPKHMLKWRERYPYPQNLLRNVAKRGCSTPYTFIPDIDMIPVKGMDLALEEFLSDPKEAACDKCAYVIPTYEIQYNVSRLPENKTELLRLIHAKQARQFHKMIFKPNQESSRLRKWEKVPMGEKLAQAYNVTNFHFKYEPLYVAKRDTPNFDERFIGFGMTRNTQVYEMYVAGYTFILLNNAFTNHWGFQTNKQRPAWRTRQQVANNQKVDKFVLGLVAKYGKDPNSTGNRIKKYKFRKSHWKKYYKGTVKNAR